MNAGPSGRTRRTKKTAARRPAGQYVFFEAGPAGRRLFVEERTGLPITAEVAALLARLDERDPERAPARLPAGRPR
ncbi:hypothetical protein ACWGI8_35795 [Streptomyces sp. NPDC054841]